MFERGAVCPALRSSKKCLRIYMSRAVGGTHVSNLCWQVCVLLLLCRSGVGAPVIGDLDGEYKHDSRRNVLEWCLPVIDANNKTGSLEFSIAGQPNDFFPISVTFVSKRNYCDIQVSWNLSMTKATEFTLSYHFQVHLYSANCYTLSLFLWSL